LQYSDSNIANKVL